MRPGPASVDQPFWTGGGLDTRRLLMIEPGAFLSILAREIPHSGAMVLCHFARLDQALVRRVMPDCVVAPLFCPAFDIMELVDLLTGSQYGGVLLIVAPPLPDPPMVIRELRAAGRGMTLQLMIFDGRRLSWAKDQG